LNWAIFAADASSSPNVSTNPGGFVSTFSQGPTGLNYTQILNADGRGGTSYLANVNLAANSTNAGGCATNPSCAQVASSPAYAGGTNFGSNVANALPAGNAINGVNGTDALPFWYIRTDSRTGNNTISPGLEFQFANSSNVGLWTLDLAGDV